MLLLRYTYHTAITAPSPLPPSYVLSYYRQTSLRNLAKYKLYNKYIRCPWILHLHCACQENQKSVLYLPLGGVQSKKGLPLIRLAQSPQRSDVRFAFLYNIGVYDRRAELEFVLENPWRHDTTRHDTGQRHDQHHIRGGRV